MAQSILERFRDAVRDGRYRVTDHALEELGEDSLHLVDLEAALLSGSIVRIQGTEPGLPGPRYTIKGAAADLSTELGVVC